MSASTLPQYRALSQITAYDSNPFTNVADPERNYLAELTSLSNHALKLFIYLCSLHFNSEDIVEFDMAVCHQATGLTTKFYIRSGLVELCNKGIIARHSGHKNTFYINRLYLKTVNDKTYEV